MIHHSECPLCSSSSTSLKFNLRDHFVTGETFPLYTCNNCGFLFTQDHPDENAISGYYESEAYISHSNTSEGLINRLYKIVRKLMLERKTRLVKSVTGLNTGNILDVGSGTGHFLKSMKDAGWETMGIEINPSAREFSTSVFNIQVYNSVDELPGNIKFDCISLWHVLEHFQDPEEYILKLKRHLNPGGFFITALPNSDSYDSHYYKENWAAYDIPRHLWHFNSDTFTIFAKKASLELSGISYLPFDVFYISMLSEKYSDKSFSNIRGLIMGMLFALGSLFKPLKASSLIYILKHNKLKS